MPGCPGSVYAVTPVNDMTGCLGCSLPSLCLSFLYTNRTHSLRLVSMGSICSGPPGRPPPSTPALSNSPSHYLTCDRCFENELRNKRLLIKVEVGAAL